MVNIVITGGGTGGHIYPALAIAGEIKARDPQSNILYIGTKEGLESKIVPRQGYSFRTINISGLDRSSIFKAAHSLSKIPLSIWQASQTLKEFKPQIVIGTGGYVSFPVVWAGSHLGCRTVIHEQNAYPGLSNRWLAKRVDCVLLTFNDSRKYLRARRVKVTGLPVRKEILTVNRKQAFRDLGLKEGVFTLLIFGGSLGAASINRAMLEIIDNYLQEKIQILWITGERGYANIHSRLEDKLPAVKKPKAIIKLCPFMHNIEKALAVADLAVCRAGASTLSELAVLGLPAILIPYPYAAENHQESNARSLVKKGAALMIKDSQLSGKLLLKYIERLRKNPSQLKEMRQHMLEQAKPHALQEIVNEILALN